MFIAGFAAVCFTGGLFLIVAGLRGTEQTVARPVRLRRELPPKAKRQRRMQIGGSAATAMLVWLVTGWLPSALLVAGAVWFLPWLLNPNKASNEQIERLDALGQWTKRLSDLVKTGTGLQEAISNSLRTVPAPIEREVADLAARLQSRMEPRRALTMFAQALRDPRADVVAAALLLRIKDPGPGLADVLSDLGARTANVVGRRRDVEADRAKHRTTTRWICAITVVVIVGFSFNRDYIAPYGTPVGLVVMLVLMSTVVAVFVWMDRLGTDTPLPGFLGHDERAAGAASPTPAEVSG